MLSISQFTVEKLCCGSVVFISATMDCYISLQSTWRGDLKNYRSVLAFISNDSKNAQTSSISKVITRILREMTWYPLQENEGILNFYKINFQAFSIKCPKMRLICYCRYNNNWHMSWKCWHSLHTDVTFAYYCFFKL